MIFSENRLKVLLVTSAIIPSNLTPSIGVNERLIQTVDALKALYASSIFDKVYIVDGTGFDLSIIHNYIAFPHGWLEHFSFKQDSRLVERYGTSYGELLIQKHFIDILGVDKLPPSIYKLSGRYTVDNLLSIFNEIELLDNYFFTFYPRFLEYRKYVQTAFYKIRTDWIYDSVTYSIKYIEGNPGCPLERAMYAWIDQAAFHKGWRKIPLPILSGFSGKTGLSISKTSFPYNFFRFLSFVPVMGFRLKKVA
jgi:hypothetical protein